MLQSMTGYGRSQVSSSQRKITVEIKSLNSKQFDLSVRIPQIFKENEISIRNYLAKTLERGKTDMSINFEQVSGLSNSTINIELLKEYKLQIEKLSEELGLPVPADWYSILMRMPDALHTESVDADEDEIKALMECVESAAGKLKEFRIQEGRKLYNFFKSKIENIGNLLLEVESYAEERVPKIKARLEEQLSKLSSIEYDKSRLEQELIFYIEKLDVTEEKVRLRSHLNYFLETMGDEDSLPKEGQGKKLGFIAQEMGREINTLGSKSNHAEMQKIVVKMKDELEQIKEQVLNVL